MIVTGLRHKMKIKDNKYTAKPKGEKRGKGEKGKKLPTAVM